MIRGVQHGPSAGFAFSRHGAALVTRRRALPPHACKTRRRLFGRCAICLGLEVAPSDEELLARRAS